MHSAEGSAQLGATTRRTRAAMDEVLAGRRGGPRAALLFAGPAVIASIAYMDPGNYATNIQAGAGYGYALLWVALQPAVHKVAGKELQHQRRRIEPDQLRGLREMPRNASAQQDWSLKRMRIQT